MRLVVIFGAGAIGRGFLGASFGRAGWAVTFVDVSEPLIERLNADGAYNQVVVSNDGEQVNRISPVSAIHISETEAVVAYLEMADFAVTAVGASNLKSVAPLLAKGIVAGQEAGMGVLDVLLAENLHDAPALLRPMIAEEVGPEAAENIGLVAASIGRMVPVPVPDPDDPTRVRVEEYSFLPYDAAAIKGYEPDVEGFVAIHDGFEMYGDRKLYVHNMGHCILAYLGELRGHEYVWEAVGDLDLRYLVRNAMVESATALATTFSVPAGPLLSHVDDLLCRFGNRALGDTVERVGRDPIRKTQPDDRLLGAFLLCRRAGVEPLYTSLGVALGAWKLVTGEGWSEQQAHEHLDQHLFADDETGRDLVRDLFEALRGGLDTPRLVAILDQTFRPSRIV